MKKILELLSEIINRAISESTRDEPDRSMNIDY
jgi:hypothetical protein